MAAKEYFKTENIELSGASSFKEVMRYVEEGKAKYAVLPAESSMSGTLQSTHDLLIQNNLFIVGEVAQEEVHCLVGMKGASVKDITKVYSHPHILEQCSGLLDKMDKDSDDELMRLCTTDSIAACRMVLEKNCAAIATSQAASEMGLEVLQEGIGNTSPMCTRYIVVSKQPLVFVNPQEPRKSSICVSFGNAPGTFHRVTACFGFRDVNIVRFVPRPSSTALEMFKGNDLKHWDYVYHIDFEPPACQAKYQRLLESLREFCITVREFGTYPCSVRNDISIDKEQMWFGANASLYI